MKLGDFSNLAKEYINRPGYSEEVLNIILSYIIKNNGKVEKIADIGAGTGKLTENLSNIGLKGFAIEPNKEMRAEGTKAFENNKNFIFLEGSAENTPLEDNSVDWVLMGSSFHWTDYKLALKEFYRILKPNGFFTAIWNPRNIEKSEIHLDIENEIKKIVPDLKRVSSGSRINMKNMEDKLLSTEYFTNLFLIEQNYDILMSCERYMGNWKSVNDIRVQAGEKKFSQILKMIESKIKDRNEIVVPYTTRAFTVRSTKK